MKRHKMIIRDDTSIIGASAISKQYHVEQLKVQALENVNLKVERGDVVAIMGPSGCGKTTLLNCLSGLESIDEGMIKIAGWDLAELSDDERTEFRAGQMGFIFQTYNLLPVLTGLENVELPMLFSGISTKLARRRAFAAIEQVGMENWIKHRPAEMSGGQRQRFTIARALATEPAIVWADEPTGALDSETSAEIIELMLRLNQQHGQTLVWVTHSLEVALKAQRLVIMRDGQIVEDGPIRDQYHSMGSEKC